MVKFLHSDYFKKKFVKVFKEGIESAKINLFKGFARKNAQDARSKICSDSLMSFGNKTYFHLFSDLV